MTIDSPAGSWAAPAGALLSACGVALLLLDVRWGLAGWDVVLYQVLGFLCGVWCFAIARQRRRCTRTPVSVAPGLVAPVLLLLPTDAPDWGIDRPLLVEVLRFAATVVFGFLVIWRRRIGGPQATSRAFDLLLFLAAECLFAVAAIVLGSLPAWIGVGAITAAMLRTGGYRWHHALAIPLIPFQILTWRVWSQPHVRARLSAYARVARAMRSGVSRAPVREWLLSGDPFRRGPWYRFFDLPSRLAREVTVVRVAGVSGLAGVAALAGLFGVITRQGCRRARNSTRLCDRVMVAGMTVALVLPMLLQPLGCFLLVNLGGPLPFVSYGPGQLVVNWIMLAYLTPDPAVET